MLCDSKIITGWEGWTGFGVNKKTTANIEDLTTITASASGGNQADCVVIRNSVGNIIGYIKKNELNHDFDTEKTEEQSKRDKLEKAMDRETEKSENKLVRGYEKVVAGKMKQHIKDIQKRIAELKKELKEHEKKLELDIRKRQRKLEIDIKESKQFEKELKKREPKKDGLQQDEKHRKILLKNEKKYRKQLLKDNKRKAKKEKEDDKIYITSVANKMKSSLKDSEQKWTNEMKALKSCMKKQK
ncbi:uncharacterized protein LOC143069608 isoform X2 [Mytilus galloprovincialis]|uniref:uncharacterized protein LOC143069608 isoform X2 n=1 Tax=Mytilus galloprovincialis TaxID=29158 RepID=UPI003F7CABFB